jgi:hypothetical protein
VPSLFPLVFYQISVCRTEHDDMPDQIPPFTDRNSISTPTAPRGKLVINRGQRCPWTSSVSATYDIPFTSSTIQVIPGLQFLRNIIPARSHPDAEIHEQTRRKESGGNRWFIGVCFILFMNNASSIGFGVAEALVSLDAHVIIISSSKDKVDNALNRLRNGAPNDSPIEGIAVSASDSNSIVEVLKDIGPFDHLVYTSAQFRSLTSGDLDSLKEAFEVKFWGAVNAATGFNHFSFELTPSNCKAWTHQKRREYRSYFWDCRIGAEEEWCHP